MKHFVRILALIMTVMMLSTTALAAPFTEDIEEKEAPEVLMQTNAQKKEAEALIRDAEGNELEMIPEEKLVITALQDVCGEDKQSEVKPEIEKRLQDAYEQLKAEKLVDVVPGIEEALKDKRANCQVGELTVHDLFDLSADDKYAELLEADGNNVSVKFRTRDIGIAKDEIVFVIQNYEEDKWRIVPDEFIIQGESEDEFIVTLDGLTPVAFLVEAGQVESSDSSHDFVPSAEQNGIPNIAAMAEDENEIIAAVVRNEADEELSRVKDESIVQEALLDADKDGKTALSQAYNELAEAEDLNELVPGLNEQLAEISTGVTAKDLVVRDIFELHLTGEDAELLAVEGNTVTMNFELGLKPNQVLSVLHKYDAENWEVIANDCVVREPNGNVTVTFESLSPIAFAVADIPADEAPADETPAEEVPAKDTPADEKSGNDGLIAVIIVAVAAVCGGTYAVVRKKKK